jgi:hypothetical protein
MKNVTLKKVTITVYAVSLVLTVLLALAGQLGSLSFDSVTGWVLALWMAGYVTIGVLLVGGTVHWVFNDALPSIRTQLSRSCK